MDSVARHVFEPKAVFLLFTLRIEGKEIKQSFIHNRQAERKKGEKINFAVAKTTATDVEKEKEEKKR